MTSAQSHPPAVYLNAMGVICAAGHDAASLRDACSAPQASGVKPNATIWSGHELCLGSVDAELAALDVLPSEQRSRNNAMMLTALHGIRAEVDAAISQFGASRVGVCIGTSTSGVAESEHALPLWRRDGTLPDSFHISQQELGSAAVALAGLLGAAGPLSGISTACSSSTKALISAARWLRTGLCDAVIAGGVDTLCAFTVAGFSALEAVSAKRCNPLSANRNGINIGEGAALFLMTREAGVVRLAGWGESSDAHHISAPDPSGRGAQLAMRDALATAGLTANVIDYINLHGTATLQNDAMESHAVSAVFGAATPVSSTKPLTGHTLGAAGAIEAAICWAALHGNRASLLPGHHWDGVVDPSLAALTIARPGSRLGRPLSYILSNSFAFGGSNASLVFGVG